MPVEAKAAVLRETNTPLTIETIMVDDPGPREIRVKTKACGVCHSDLHMAEGSYPWKYPTVLGHESAGIIEAVGDQVTDLKVGDTVITCLSVFCGNCEYCLSARCPFAKTRRACGLRTSPALEPRRPGNLPIRAALILRGADVGA